MKIVMLAIGIVEFEFPAFLFSSALASQRVREIQITRIRQRISPIHTFFVLLKLE